MTERWSEAAIQTLIKMWMGGYSGTAIAEALGRGYSRSAVMGKVYRLPILRQEARVPRARAAPRTRAGPAAVVSSLPPLPANFQKPPEDLIRSALYAEDDGCKWPIGDPRQPDFHSCNAPRVDRNYCAKHKAIATGKAVNLAPKSFRRYGTAL